ncbi:MAG: hypothetical protein RQ736_12520 [Thiogranum sp.]|nr:hypothetical protein [Thiogranum sp.]
MLTRLLNLFRPSPTEPSASADEFTQAIKAYARRLKSPQGRDIDAAPINEQAGLVLFDIALRALMASGHLAEVNDVDEQIALLMFVMLGSSPLVAHLRKEGHDIQHDSVFAVAAAAFTANLDASARKQTIDLSTGLFKRFIEEARKKEQFNAWLGTNRHMIWGLVVSDDPKMRQALAAHYIALRTAVDQLR